MCLSELKDAVDAASKRGKAKGGKRKDEAHYGSPWLTWSRVYADGTACGQIGGMLLSCQGSIISSIHVSFCVKFIQGLFLISSCTSTLRNHRNLALQLSLDY